MKTLLVALLITACRPADPAASYPCIPAIDTGDEIECPAPSLSIGTGSTGWSELEPGDYLRLNHGPAGGWSVDASALLVGLSQTISVTGTLLRQATGKPINTQAGPSYYLTAGYQPKTCVGIFYGHRLFLDPQPAQGETQQEWVCDLVDVELQMCLDVGEYEGEHPVVSQCISLVAIADPIDAELCEEGY